MMGFSQPRGQQMPVVFTTDTPFVHDPVMAVEEGVHYVYFTGFNIGKMTSADRKTWTVYRDGVLDEIPAWTRDSVPGFRSHVWAPDIIKWHDKWWLAYSCSTFGKNTSAIGVVSASSLAQDDWEDKGCLVASKGHRDQWNAIDPNFAIDKNNRLWVTWGSFWDGIQMSRVKEKDGRLVLVGKQQTIARRYPVNATPDASTNPTSKFAGANAIEAPFILQHGKWFYLFVSWDYCCRGAKSNYRTVVGRSKKINGPYVDAEGKLMTEGGGTPVIQGDMVEFEAAGHNAAYHLADGDLFICHGYSIPLKGQSILIQRRIRWENDWPVLE